MTLGPSLLGPLKFNQVNEIFEKNLRALEADDREFLEFLKPSIAEFRANPQPSDYQVVHQNGLMNLNVRGQLVEAPDVVSSVQEFLRVLAPHEASSLVCFGGGTGYATATVMHMPLPYLKGVFVYEPDVQILLRSFCVHDFSSFFSPQGKRLFFATGDASQLRKRLLQYFYAVKDAAIETKIQATKYFEQNVPQPVIDQLKAAVIEQRGLLAMLVGNDFEDWMLGFKNAIDNLDLVLHSAGIRPLQNYFAGKTAISIGSGPQVNEAIPYLRQLVGKVPMIASESCLRPLLEGGVVPDFVTAIERTPMVTKYFDQVKGLVPERCSLLAPNLILKDTWDAYERHKIPYGHQSSFNTHLGMNFVGDFFAGSSTGNLNITSAIYMGFKNIILVGHNLAYSSADGTEHVQGAMLKDRTSSKSKEELEKLSHGLQLPTQDGTEMVYSNIDRFLPFKMQIEFTITQHKNDVRFINTALKGARIEGAEGMSLESAIAECVGEPVDVFEIKQRLLSNPSEETVKRRATETRQNAEKLKALGERRLIQVHEILKAISRWPKSSESVVQKINQFRENAFKGDPVFAEIFLDNPQHEGFERELHQNLVKLQNDGAKQMESFVRTHQKMMHSLVSLIPRFLKEFERTIKTCRDIERQSRKKPLESKTTSEAEVVG